MNAAYVYLQLYRLFDRSTPAKSDCGILCDSACCKGDDSGMYLFPGEQCVYDLLQPEWVQIEESDFFYEHNGKKRNVPIAFCNGRCDRYQRPLACRIFPLTPFLEEDGTLSIIIDPRAKSLCPLAENWELSDFEEKFITNIKKAFHILLKNGEFRSFMRAYSDYLSEFRRFFKVKGE